MTAAATLRREAGLDDNAAGAALAELHHAHGALRALAGLACGERLGNDLHDLEREDLASLLRLLGEHLRRNSQVLSDCVDDCGIRRCRHPHAR